MNKLKKNALYTATALATLLYVSCGVPKTATREANTSVPQTYANGSTDTLTSAQINWNTFFKDPNLTALVDQALQNNQELNILLQEISIAKNEVKARKGEYLPFVTAGAGAGIDKVGRYTSQGASDEANEIAPGKKFPDPLPNYGAGVQINWEVDIWKKLRNAKQAALHRYLATVEGRNFMVTHLIAEVAISYYELLALDAQLEMLQQNIAIQQNALEVVKLEKTAARVTELAVRKFEAEVLKNQSRQYEIQQQIVETENHINYLVGRFPQPILRTTTAFTESTPALVNSGIPSQLLANRPDIRQAEQQVMASKLDIKAARAAFYPSFAIRSGIGYSAFNPSYFLKTPESLVYSLAGDLVAPLLNRNAIKANFLSANNRQVQAAFGYERTVLNAYIEVANQLARIQNLNKSYELKDKQVAALVQSIDLSTLLFKSARADYMEVLLTQRDALESKMELIETKKQQFAATVNLYRALGGGWK